MEIWFDDLFILLLGKFVIDKNLRLKLEKFLIDKEKWKFEILYEYIYENNRGLGGVKDKKK